MTIRDRIIQYLRVHPEGIDDDEIAKALKLSARQQANSRCRQLEREGIVVRRQVDGKIHNFWAGGQGQEVSPAVNTKVSDTTQSSHWFWEGNVQSGVVAFLVAQGHSIHSVANTATHQQGIDIIAEKDGESLWISVKGYPRGTDKTNPTVQAGHWFKQVIFDMIEYRQRDQNVFLAVALPDFPRYRKLASKITWFQSAARFSYYWVSENGHVSVE